MNQRKIKLKRSLTLQVLLVPAWLAIGFMGWCVGDNQKELKPKRKLLVEPVVQRQPRADFVTLMPVIRQEEQELVNH